ncbi:MAG: UDP-N-acetylglucosamine 2-epimerase (non-hydrolyzing) [Candidatus Parcubacteria bacterium]|nr:UDP-N-acetylglucosamine 2-epimerase (non-hydrolyzing) [Candidatus Parcubacteria bacterium]
MIAILIGTRPEFIKLAPVLRAFQKKKVPYILIHSGQHYSQELDKQIIEDLKLPVPDYNLDVGSGSQAEQTGKIMLGVEQILIKEKPEVLVVQGDTNTMLAGSLAAIKLHIPIAHVEAGLRSFDNRMPEEINRIITDRISTFLFAPTEGTKQNLLREGVAEDKILVTGNTVVDALIDHLPLAKKSSILKQTSLKKDDYILVTAHRAETVDEPERLKALISLLNYATVILKKKIVWPIHPRTMKQISTNNIKLDPDIQTIPPTGYLDMLALMNNAAFIMTDSGGIQEEAYILKKRLVTLRNSTERPETLTANFLVDLDKDKFKQAVEAFEKGNAYWKENIFGKGIAGELITKSLTNFLKKNVGTMH